MSMSKPSSMASSWCSYTASRKAPPTRVMAYRWPRWRESPRLLRRRRGATCELTQCARPHPTALTLGEQFLVHAPSHDFLAEWQTRQILRRAAAIQRRTQEHDSPWRQLHAIGVLEQLQYHQAPQPLAYQGTLLWALLT